MPLIVVKFGGAALENAGQFQKLSRMIANRVKENLKIAIVVSAMGKTTDALIKLAHCVHPNPPKREKDMLLSIGERISMSLFAMALDYEGLSAMSFTGSQSGIITTEDHSKAEIIEVNPKRIIEALEQRKIPIIAGFQGMSRKKEITVLERGGSDFSAVAIAVALGAKKVEFYKDVPGIGKENPKTHPNTEIFSHLSYDQALKIIKEGAEILNEKSLQFAQKENLELEIRSFFEPEKKGTVITNEP